MDSDEVIEEKVEITLTIPKEVSQEILTQKMHLNSIS